MFEKVKHIAIKAKDAAVNIGDTASKIKESHAFQDGLSVLKESWAKLKNKRIKIEDKEAIKEKVTKTAKTPVKKATTTAKKVVAKKITAVKKTTTTAKKTVTKKSMPAKKTTTVAKKTPNTSKSTTTKKTPAAKTTTAK